MNKKSAFAYNSIWLFNKLPKKVPTHIFKDVLFEFLDINGLGRLETRKIMEIPL